MTKLFSILIGSILLTACNNPLTVSDNLTPEQRKAWRVAMVFPSHCKDGMYEWLDMEDMPFIYFRSMARNRTLVYSVCERYAYQDEVNAFLLNSDKTRVRLIHFPVMEHVESNDSYKVNLSARLVKRGIEVLPDDHIRVTRHYSGMGTCGTLTTYSVNDQSSDVITARVVEFRAQTSCSNKQLDMMQWPLYKLTCPNNKPGPGCTVKRVY